MGALKQLAFFAEQAHVHHTMNGVPKDSAIQHYADQSPYAAEDIRWAYERLYADEEEE